MVTIKAQVQPCLVCGNPVACCISEKHIGCMGPQRCEGCKAAKKPTEKALIWQYANGDWKGFAPAYPWIFGERYEDRTGTPEERRAAIVRRVTEAVQQSASPVPSHVEVIEIEVSR